MAKDRTGEEHNQERGRRKRRRAQRTGQRAEARAALALRLKGYRILARSWRTAAIQAGEIDIIAKRGKVIAFVEVKSRSRIEQAIEAISAAQQARIVAAAGAFMQGSWGRGAHSSTYQWRFDAILVVPGRWPVHIRDAWRPHSSGR
jgi:putative endonuclease